MFGFGVSTSNYFFNAQRTMRNFYRESQESPFSIPVSQNPHSSLKGSGSLGSGLHNWLFECHGFLHNLTLIVASLAFVLYLAFQAKMSVRKLSHGRSYIMIAYYGCLWLVSLLNLAWCFFQVCHFQFGIQKVG